MFMIFIVRGERERGGRGDGEDGGGSREMEGEGRACIYLVVYGQVEQVVRGKVPLQCSLPICLS